MTVYREISLQDLIEETLDILYRNTERPKAVRITSALDAGASIVTLTVDDPTSVTVGTVLELGLERVLVTAASSGTNPTYSVMRGYAGDAPAAHATGSVGVIDPRWSRAQVRRAVVRCVSGPMAVHSPYHVSETFFLPDDPSFEGTPQSYIAVPDDTFEVLSVRYMSPGNGRIVDVPGWRFENDLPTEMVSTGRAVRVPSFISTADDLIVNYTRPYPWIDDHNEEQPVPLAESWRVPLPLGAEDVPALYAAAYLSSGRELTRQDVDRAEEWNQSLADSRGINLQAIRAAWQLYYQRIDEVHRRHPMPKKRVFRRWQKPF